MGQSPKPLPLKPLKPNFSGTYPQISVCEEEQQDTHEDCHVQRKVTLQANLQATTDIQIYVHHWSLLFGNLKVSICNSELSCKLSLYSN